MPTQLKIGFAYKFYTLWEMTQESRYEGKNRIHIVTDYKFIKNISIDREVVEQKYPGIEIDEALRGKSHSFFEEKYVWTEQDKFRFGKYAGVEISKCYDYSYLAWYYTQIDESQEEHRSIIRSVLIDHGYEVKGDIVMSPKEVQERKEMKERTKEFIKMAENGELLEFTPEYNLDSSGIYRQDLIFFKFPEVKEMYYQGYVYFLPVINGKTKRIKNKNIIVSEYTYKIVKDSVVIYIEKFEVTK